MAYRVGFMMDQIAGHITNYRNLRQAVASEQEIMPEWFEIYYLKPNGWIERLHRRLPFIPAYYPGVMRGAWEMWRGMRHYRRFDAVMSNVSVGVFFSPLFRQVPTLIDFDSTPLQIDRMAAYDPGHHHVQSVEHLKYRLSRSMLRAAAKLQAWSHWARQSAISEYGVSPERVFVNPPGVNLEFWHPRADDTAAEQRPRRILFVGADFRRKGGLVLLDWFSSQDPAQYELHLVTREPVAARPGIHVYSDMQPNTDRLRALYHRSDLFVLPSLGECFGIATVEAMGAGLPVIASDVGGTADIIIPGENGHIVPANDQRALGEAITSILADEPRRQSMGRRSRQLAEQRFDVQHNAQRTFDMLKQIAATRGERQQTLVKRSGLG